MLLFCYFSFANKLRIGVVLELLCGLIVLSDDIYILLNVSLRVIHLLVHYSLIVPLIASKQVVLANYLRVFVGQRRIVLYRLLIIFRAEKSRWVHLLIVHSR